MLPETRGEIPLVVVQPEHRSRRGCTSPHRNLEPACPKDLSRTLRSRARPAVSPPSNNAMNPPALRSRRLRTEASATPLGPRVVASVMNLNEPAGPALTRRVPASRNFKIVPARSSRCSWKMRSEAGVRVRRRYPNFRTPLREVRKLGQAFRPDILSR